MIVVLSAPVSTSIKWELHFLKKGLLDSSFLFTVVTFSRAPSESTWTKVILFSFSSVLGGKKESELLTWEVGYSFLPARFLFLTVVCYCGRLHVVRVDCAWYFHFQNLLLLPLWCLSLGFFIILEVIHFYWINCPNRSVCFFDELAGSVTCAALVLYIESLSVRVCHMQQHPMCISLYNFATSCTWRFDVRWVCWCLWWPELGCRVLSAW